LSVLLLAFLSSEHISLLVLALTLCCYCVFLGKGRACSLASGGR